MDLIDAGSFGVAAFPRIARRATAFLMSIEGVLAGDSVRILFAFCVTAGLAFLLRDTMSLGDFFLGVGDLAFLTGVFLGVAFLGVGVLAFLGVGVFAFLGVTFLGEGVFAFLGVGVLDFLGVIFLGVGVLASFLGEGVLAFFGVGVLAFLAPTDFGVSNMAAKPEKLTSLDLSGVAALGDMLFLLAGVAALALAGLLAGVFALAGLFAGDFALAGLLAGDLALAGLFAGDLALAGLFAGDFALAGLFAGDFALAGLLAGDLAGDLAGLLAGDLALAGLLAGDLAGLLAGDLALAGLLAGDLAGLFPGDLPFPGLSSRIVAARGVANDKRFNAVVFPLTGADFLRGEAPRLTGVAGGRDLSKCSGLNAGPKETRFARFAADSAVSVDFLFWPLGVGAPVSQKKGYELSRLS